MYDYGEYVDPQNLFADGRTGYEVHNDYPNIYHEAAYEVVHEFEQPEEGYAPEYVYYVRSGYSGSQANTWSVWTGDPYCDFSKHTGLRSQVSAMLAIGLSGFPFVGSDISGFTWIKPPSLDLWVRWSQVGLLSGTMHTQTGGTSMVGHDKSHIHDWPEGTFAWRMLAKLRT